MSSAEGLSDYEQRIVDCIDEPGWFCVNVFGIAAIAPAALTAPAPSSPSGPGQAP